MSDETLKRIRQARARIITRFPLFAHMRIRLRLPPPERQRLWNLAKDMKFNGAVAEYKGMTAEQIYDAISKEIPPQAETDQGSSATDS